MSQPQTGGKSLTYCVTDWFRINHRSIKKNWLGKFLTIVDASISDPEQRKAIKDIVKSQFWDESLENRYSNYLARELSELIEPTDDTLGIGKGSESGYHELENPDFEYIRK